VANETFLDASGATKYRKSTGAGSVGDPAVAHNIIDGTVTVTGAGGTFPVTDNGGSLTVDGTVAATQSGTWTVQPGNTANTTAWLVTGTGGTFPVTDNGGSLTVDGTVAISGSVAVTGTFWQTTQPVSIASTLTVTGTGGTFPVTDSGGSLTIDAPVGTPAFVRLSDGTNAIATLPVSLASVPSHAVTNAGTFVVQENGGALTALQLIDNIVLAEDAAHVSGDAGIQSLAVRNDSDTSLAGTTGDYTPLQVDANGYLKVNIKAGAGSGGTASTDDAAFTAGSGSGTPIMGFVTSDLVDSGDVGVIGMLANRQVKVTLYDSAGAELAVGGGTQYDEDTAHVSGDKLTMAGAVRRDTASSGVSADGDRATINVDANGLLWTVVGAALPAGTNNIGDVDVLTLPALATGSNTIGNIGTIATSITPGTAADNLGKAEDAVHATGDTGVAVWSVRRDTAASGAGTAGDYASLNTDSTGHLWTRVGLALPAGTNNIGDIDVLTVITGTGATNLGKAEDAVHASGDTGVAVWAVRRNTATSGTSADGDYASLNVDTNGLLWTNVGAALPAGTNLIGQIVTRPDVSNASDGSTVLVPKFARLSTASTGNQAIVSAVSGKKIRVLSMNVMATASTNAIWINDGTADLHGTTSYKIPLDVTGATGAGGFVLPFNQLGWFETAANNRPININLGSANGITAIVTYVEV
jgi:hypothetical protein